MRAKREPVPGSEYSGTNEKAPAEATAEALENSRYASEAKASTDFAKAFRAIIQVQIDVSNVMECHKRIVAGKLDGFDSLDTNCYRGAALRLIPVWKALYPPVIHTDFESLMRVSSGKFADALIHVCEMLGISDVDDYGAHFNAAKSDGA